MNYFEIFVYGLAIILTAIAGYIVIFKFKIYNS